MGLLAQLAELNRQGVAKDNKFFRQFLYYFELRVPPHMAGALDTFFFPLAIAPGSLSMSEPFAVTTSFGDGSLFVEEKGIIARELHISGTTGWAPRRFPKLANNGEAIAFPKNRSFTRSVAANIVHALSGQRHFQILNDRVFRTYADLKRDPATSDGTELYFHNVKDDEHWRVIPRRFDLAREASKPLEYQYDIQMIAVQASGSGGLKVSEDNEVLAMLRDAPAMMRAGIAGIRAGIQDLALVQHELRKMNAGFIGLLDGVVGIADETEALVDGTATIIGTPFQLGENAIKAGLDALLQLNTGVEDSTAVGAPANLLNTIRGIVDSTLTILSYPQNFQNNVQAAVERYQQRQALATSRRSDTLIRAAQQGPPATIQGFSASQDARAGDLLRARNQVPLGLTSAQYTSASEHRLEQGDTLANLAARFLGDARRWRFIALFNSLVYPFISETGAAGTLRIGDTILIPGFGDTTSPSAPSEATFGVRPEESPEVHALGRDWLMESVGNGLYDLAVNTSGGSIDCRTVEGRTNLSQAVRTRVITERGTDILYKRLGCGRAIGVGLTELDFETIQFRIVEAVEADPRIAGVRDLSFESDQPDAVVARLVAEVRGFTRPEKILVEGSAA